MLLASAVRNPRFEKNPRYLWEGMETHERSSKKKKKKERKKERKKEIKKEGERHEFSTI
jgi:hypothetical protein